MYMCICIVIFATLHTDEELPSFPVDSAYLKAIRRRVSLARQIHKIEHQRNKSVRAEQWLSKSAKALDIELDEDLYPIVLYTITTEHIPWRGIDMTLYRVLNCPSCRRLCNADDNYNDIANDHNTVLCYMNQSLLYRREIMVW